MTLPASHDDQPVPQNNVRLVVVDDRHRPVYLRRADELERRLLAAAAKLDITVEDMPGLHGLCVEAIRSSEARSA